MARGQSPYQGRYTVPIADFSGIERAGAAWGDAFKGIGEQVEKYQLNKRERLTTEAEIEGILANNPEMRERTKAHSDMGPLLQKQIDGKANLSDTRQLYSFLKSNTAEQDRMRNARMAELAEEVAGYKRDAVARNNLFIKGKQDDLKSLDADKARWLERGVTEDEWVENTTPSQRRLLGNRELIEAGVFTPQNELDSLREKYDTERLIGLSEMLPRQFERQKEETERAAEIRKLGPTPQEEADAQRAQLKAIPQKIKTELETAEENLEGLRWRNTDQVRQLSVNGQKADLDYKKALIDRLYATSETERLKVLAAMNPSDAKQYEANDEAVKSAMSRIVRGENSDGKVFHKPYSEWLGALELDKDLVPSAAIKQIDGLLNTLLLEQEQIGRSTHVYIDDSSPAEQAADTQNNIPSMPTFEEWKGGFMGFGEGSYKEYVDEMKSKGYHLDQLSPPPVGVPDYRHQ